MREVDGKTQDTTTSATDHGLAAESNAREERIARGARQKLARLIGLHGGRVQKGPEPEGPGQSRDARMGLGSADSDAKGE